MTPIPPSPPDSISPELLDRYWAGECTPLEAAAVDAWLATSPAWRRATDRLDSMRLSPGDAGESRVSTADALERLRTRIPAPRSNGLPAPSVGDPQSDSPAPAGSAAVLRASSRGLMATRFNLRMVRGVAVAMGVAAVAVLWVGRRVVSRGARVDRLDREYVVRAGERATVTLLDGTRVTLGPQSRLRYPSTFSGDQRVVQLDGAAYFDVQHDMRHPFVVVTTAGVVQELGTAFGVMAYPGDSLVRVAVTDGRVALRARGTGAQGGMALVRGDVGQLNAQGLATLLRGANVDDALAWTQGRLVFDDMALRDVARVLSRTFDVEITFATPALANRRVTAAFGDAPLNDVMSELSQILRIRYVRTDRKVTVTE